VSVRPPAAIVATVEQAARRRYQDLDAKVDRAEGDGLAARWAFGQAMEREATNGRMPHGRLDELVELTGKSRAELKHRHRFFTENPKLAKALASFRTWDAFVNPNTPGGESKAALYTSESGDWETPQELFDVLHAEFGFDLDVCATKETAKCKRFFSPKDDGLSQEWRGVCWMNPPYIETTIARYYAIEVQDDVWLVVRTSLLRVLTNEARRRGLLKRRGDNNNLNVMLPVEWLVRGIPRDLP